MADNNQTDVVMSRFRKAFDLVLPEIEAVPESELAAMNVDVPQAVTSAVGSWKEISSLRERLVTELVKFDVERFDKIETYALAAGHAHALFIAASNPAGMQEVIEEATKMRELLYSDALALSKRGLIDGSRFKELKGPQGHRNLAFDLLALSAMMREKWSELQGKTALQLSEIETAEALADQVVSGVGAREQGPTIVLEAADRRRRAFSLFAKVYDQARRAVTYLRWDHGDVDDIAPSLYAGRGGSRRRATETPTAPVTTPVAPVAQPAVANNAGAATQHEAVAGLPGGRAFTAS